MSVDPIETSEAVPRGAIVERTGEMSRAFRNWLERGNRQQGKVISGIATLNSAVQVIQGQITEIDGSLSTYYGISVDGGGNGAILRLSDGASFGSAISLSADEITLDADAINFGAQTEFDTTTETFITEAGGVRTRYGAPFGASSDVLRWYGPTSVAQGSETKTNGYLAEGTDGVLYIGTAPVGWGATASEAAASNARVPVGGNLLVDTAFARGTQFWSVGGFNTTGLTLDAGLNLAGPYFNASRNVFYGTVTGTPASGTVFTVFNNIFVGQARFSVIAGERLYARFLGAVYRAGRVYMGLVWFNADGSNTVSDTEICSTSFADGSAALNGVTFGVAEGYATVPAGVVGVDIYFRVVCNGGTNPFAFIAEPMVARVPAGQTATGIPYIPGRPDPRGDRTNDNTAAAIAGQGVFATGDYYEQSSDPASAPNGSLLFRTDTNQLKIRRSGSWGVVATIAPNSITVTPSTSTLGGSALPGNTATTGTVTLTPSGGTPPYTWRQLGGIYVASQQSGAGAASVFFSKLISPGDNTAEPISFLFADTAGRTGTVTITVGFTDAT